MTEKRPLLLSPLAESDLIDIGAYIAGDNSVRARTFILELRAFVEKIAANSYIGRPRNELRRGLRSVPFVGYSYTIFYRLQPRGRGIKVERVLHGARDFSRLL